MSARQIAALLKSSRQDGLTNNNNNRMYAHQVHNNNMINTTMYPEQQLSADFLIGQNVQPAQFTNNFNINVNINMNATNNATNNNPQQQNIKSADINYSSTIPLMVPSTAAVCSYPSGLMQHVSSGGDGYQTQQNNITIPPIPHQFNMQSYCKRNYDNTYETTQRPQKQLKREQYSGVVSGDNNELYQDLSNKFGETIMDNSTASPEFNNWLPSKDWRKMVSLHQVASSESRASEMFQKQYLLRSKTRTRSDRDRDIAKYKRIDLIHLLKWQELNFEEKIDSITTITSPTTFKNKNKSTNPRNLYKIVDPNTGRIVGDNTYSGGKGRTKTFVKVPSNVRPGEKFQALVDDQIIKVCCPLDTKLIMFNEERWHHSIYITVPVTEDTPDKLRKLGKLDTNDQPILKQIKELEDICLRAHFISDRTSKMTIINKIQELRYGYDDPEAVHYSNKKITWPNTLEFDAYYSVNHSTDEDLVRLTEAYKKDQDIISAKKSVLLDKMKVQVSAYTIKEQASMRAKNAIINVYIDQLQYYRLLLVRHLRRCHKVILEKKSRGEKFLDSERYVQMHKLKQECITRGFLQYANPKDTKEVPLNLYIGECEHEWKAIMYRLQRFLDNGNRCEKRVGQYITKLRGLELEQISKRNELVSMGVIIIRGQDRDLYIPPPANRYFYMKSEAICVVTSQTVTSSVDRKLLIGGIAKAGYVSSESTFYDVLRRFENGETILDDCWARGKKWRFEYNSPTPTFTNKCIKMPMCTASVMNATGMISYNDCIDKSLPPLSTSTRDTTEDTAEDTSSTDVAEDTTEDTSSIDTTEDTSSTTSTATVSTSDTGPLNSYRIGVSGERLSFLLLKTTPVTFHQLRYLDASDLTKPDEIDVSMYIGGDSMYEVDNDDTTWKYKNELNEGDMEAYVGKSWKDSKEKDPDWWVEEQVMGNKICRLYLSTTEFPPLEPPKEIVSDECKLPRRVAPGGPSKQTRNQHLQRSLKQEIKSPIPWEYHYENRDLLAELGLGTERTKYYYDLIQAADCDIPRHEESTKKKEEKREAKRKHDRNMAMLSRVAKYITTKSKECGSPLVSRVYDKNKYIFQCQHCYKTDRECFTFKVAFDQHGFYIPLLNEEADEITLGRAWHNCECPIPEDIKKRLVYDSDGSESSGDNEKARCYCNSCQLYRILGPPYRECSKSKA